MAVTRIKPESIYSTIGVILWVVGYLTAFAGKKSVTASEIGMATTTVGYLLMIWSMIRGWG